MLLELRLQTEGNVERIADPVRQIIVSDRNLSITDFELSRVGDPTFLKVLVMPLFFDPGWAAPIFFIIYFYLF